jgi:hypothetical protein
MGKTINQICKLCGREELKSENLVICAWCIQKLNIAEDYQIKELLRRLEEVQAYSKIKIIENYRGITLKERKQRVRGKPTTKIPSRVVDRKRDSNQDGSSSHNKRQINPAKLLD